MQINLLNLQISKKYIRRSFYRKRNKKDHKKNSLYKLNNSQKQKRKTKEKLNFKFKFCEFRRNPTKKRQARDTKSSKKMHLKTLGNLDRLVNFKIFENQSSFLNPKFQQGDSGLSKTLFLPEEEEKINRFSWKYLDKRSHFSFDGRKI